MHLVIDLISRIKKRIVNNTELCKYLWGFQCVYCIINVKMLTSRSCSTLYVLLLQMKVVLSAIFVLIVHHNYMFSKTWL